METPAARVGSRSKREACGQHTELRCRGERLGCRVTAIPAMAHDLQPQRHAGASVDVTTLREALPDLPAASPTPPPPLPTFSGSPTASRWASQPPSAAPVFDTAQIVSQMIDNIFSNVILSIETQEVTSSVGKMRVSDAAGGRRHTPARHQPYSAPAAPKRREPPTKGVNTTNGYY